MKRLALIIALTLGFAATASAKDNYYHDASVLPEAAKTTISNNFKSKVSIVKIDKKLGKVSEYEVILTDGSEISFDSKGNWENVETNKSSSVPSGFVPKAISEYVKKNQPDTHIVGIDKERSGYDIELSNGVDIKFDKDGRFIRYDN